MHQHQTVLKSVWFIHYLMDNTDHLTDQQQPMLLDPRLEYTHLVLNVKDPIQILVRQFTRLTDAYTYQRIPEILQESKYLTKDVSKYLY